MAFAKSRLFLLPVLIAGCTSFDQSDDGTSREVLLGKLFTVALPALAQPRAAQVQKENIVRFVVVHRNSPLGMDTFEFKAVGTGETDIHIPKAPTPSEGSDFVLTVKVVLGGTPY